MSNKALQSFPFQRTYSQRPYIWCCIWISVWFLQLSHFGKSIRHLNIRSGKDIGVSPFTRKKVTPSNNSAVCYHLLHCRFLSSFDSVLAQENEKYIFEIKERFLIMRNKRSLSRFFNSVFRSYFLKSRNKLQIISHRFV